MKYKTLPDRQASDGKMSNGPCQGERTVFFTEDLVV
jgi:hypothetical protein